MKIFLTGANGMVGKNILNHINFNQYKFYAPQRQELNLLNQDEVYEYIKKHDFDFIIHSAGIVGGIQANMMAPDKFLVENIQMGMNVVLGAQKAGIKNLLNLGSSCMYPKGHDEPLVEELILSGSLEPTNEGYAIAKIAVAKLCQYITEKNKEYHYKTIIPCNLYGKWDKFDSESSHMIPAIISKVHHAKCNYLPFVEIWGDGKARREFMYAEDCAEAIYFSIENFSKLDCYTNIGLGYDHTVNEYYEIIARVLKYEGKFKHNPSKPSGMNRKLVDVSKIQKLGWKPKFTLEAGTTFAYKYYLDLISKN